MSAPSWSFRKSYFGGSYSFPSSNSSNPTMASKSLSFSSTSSFSRSRFGASLMNSSTWLPASSASSKSIFLSKFVNLSGYCYISINSSLAPPFSVRAFVKFSSFSSGFNEPIKLGISTSSSSLASGLPLISWSTGSSSFLCSSFRTSGVTSGEISGDTSSSPYESKFTFSPSTLSF